MSDVDATTSNGTSSNDGAVSAADQFAADRAAFLARTSGDPPVEAKPAKSAPAPKADDEDDEATTADDDSDLDDEDTEEVEAKGDADEDPDADLDDEEDKPATDPKVARGIAQVQRTDKRLREQREQMWAAKDRDFEKREADLKPRIERVDRLEKLLERARHEPELLLAEAGITSDEDMTHAFRRLYAMTEAGKKDPKTRAAVDQLAKERERDAKISKMEKEREEERATARKAAEEAEHRRNVDSHVDNFAKAASDRYPLAKTFLEKNPQRARADLEVVAGRLIQQHGVMPEPKAVMVAFEKERRQFLRDHGIDPKSRAGASANASDATKTDKKPALKVGEKKPAPKAKTDDSKPLTKEDYIRGQYD